MKNLKNQEVCDHLDSYTKIFKVLRILCVKKTGYVVPPLTTTKRTQRHLTCTDLYHAMLSELLW